jgi:hypothetical protein
MSLRDAGQNALAAAAFRRYLADAPAATDRAFVQRYLDTLEAKP